MRPAVDPLSPLRSDPRGRAFDRIGAAAVAAVALGARLLHLARIRETPLFDRLVPEAARHLAGAERIAGGDWTWAVADPWGGSLYPALLAAILRVSGGSLMAPRVVQCLLGAATCLLVFLTARRLMGRGAGLAAGLLAAVYAPFVLADGALSPAAWMVFLTASLMAALVASEGSRRMHLLGAGLLLGFALLLRASLLLVAPAVALWLAADTVIRGRMTSGHAREAAARVLFFLAGVALVGLPVAAAATLAGEGAPPGSISGPWMAVSGDPGAIPPPGGPPGPAGSLWRLLGAAERSSGLVLAHHRHFVPALRALPAWPLVFPLAVAGAVLCLSGWRDQLPLAALAAGLLASGIPPGEASAFRLLLTPVPLLFAGGALASLPSLLAPPRRPARLAAAAAAALAGLILVLIPRPPDPFLDARSEGRLAGLMARAGETDRARELSSRAVETLQALGTGEDGPDRPAPGAAYDALLSELCLERAGMEEAAGSKEAALAWSARAAAAAPSGEGGAEALVSHARRLVEAGRPREALDPVERARRIDPTRLEPAAVHARALHGAGRSLEAVRLLEEALAAAPDPEPGELAGAARALGLIFRDLGDLPRMRFHLREALRIQPDHPRAAELRRMLEEADRREGVETLPVP